jgi:hypothetical protein
MKNLHILPTDKPSRLLYFGTSKELTLQVNPATFRVFERSTQNIYITSDEEIKEGDWVIYNNKVFKIGRGDNELFHLGEKIILTTDQDLINNGIQAIDDEFLEWFIKNPSCEKVEVVKEMYMPQSNGKISDGKITHELSLNPSDNTLPFYKIIIPQEEPKFKNRQIGAAGFVANKIMENAISKFKQETLEEAAESRYGTDMDSIRGSNVYDLNTDLKKGFINGAKWQAKKMYSEEEVKRICSKAWLKTPNTPNMLEEFDKWFEQVKKK